MNSIKTKIIAMFIVIIMCINYIFPLCVYAENYYSHVEIKDNGDGTVSLMDGDDRVVATINTVDGKIDANGYKELIKAAADYVVAWKVVELIKEGNSAEEIVRSMVFYYSEDDSDNIIAGGGSMSGELGLNKYDGFYEYCGPDLIKYVLDHAKENLSTDDEWDDVVTEFENHIAQYSGEREMYTYAIERGEAYNGDNAKEDCVTYFSDAETALNFVKNIQENILDYDGDEPDSVLFEPDYDEPKTGKAHIHYEYTRGDDLAREVVGRWIYLHFKDEGIDEIKEQNGYLINIDEQANFIWKLWANPGSTDDNKADTVQLYRNMFSIMTDGKNPEDFTYYDYDNWEDAYYAAVIYYASWYMSCHTHGGYYMCYGNSGSVRGCDFGLTKGVGNINKIAFWQGRNIYSPSGEIDKLEGRDYGTGYERGETPPWEMYSTHGAQNPSTAELDYNIHWWGEEAKDYTGDQSHVDIDTLDYKYLPKNSDGVLGGILDTILGFILYIPKLGLLVPGLVVNSVTSLIAAPGSTEVKWITLDSILFNKGDVKLTDVNIFDTKSEGLAPVIVNIRTKVAGWYYALRDFSLCLALLALIYTGIRIAINSAGSKKAKYKKLLVDWAIGFGLIMVFHYVIVLVLKVNTAIVDSLGYQSEQAGITDQMLSIAFEIGVIRSFGAAIIYSVLSVITFIFLIIYIKRMLMTCFLIMIAPLVPLSYSIGGNKSSIFMQWLKEFCYNVFIQPFHCIVYIVFAGTSLNLLYSSNGINGTTILNTIYAVACVCFIFVAEKVIRTIFGFTKSKSVASKLFTASMVTSAVNNINQIRNAKNKDEEDEEEEMPAVMPSNVTTTEAMTGYSSKVKLQDVGFDEGGAGIGWATSSGRTNSNSGSNEGIGTETGNERSQASGNEPSSSASTSTAGNNIGEASTTSSRRTQSNNQKARQPMTKDIDSIENETTEVQQNSKSNKKAIKKKIEQYSMEEQFLMAVMQYRDTKNPEMTREQLIQKIDMLRRTSMSKLEEKKDFADIVFKTWIDKTEKNYAKRGSKNPSAEIHSLVSHLKM